MIISLLIRGFTQSHVSHVQIYYQINKNINNFIYDCKVQKFLVGFQNMQDLISKIFFFFFFLGMSMRIVCIEYILPKIPLVSYNSPCQEIKIKIKIKIKFYYSFKKKQKLYLKIKKTYTRGLAIIILKILYYSKS